MIRLLRINDGRGVLAIPFRDRLLGVGKGTGVLTRHNGRACQKRVPNHEAPFLLLAHGPMLEATAGVAPSEEPFVARRLPNVIHSRALVVSGYWLPTARSPILDCPGRSDGRSAQHSLAGRSPAEPMTVPEAAPRTHPRVGSPTLQRARRTRSEFSRRIPGIFMMTSLRVGCPGRHASTHSPELSHSPLIDGSPPGHCLRARG